MEKREPILTKSASIEKRGGKENLSEIEGEVLVRIEEIRGGNCIIGEGKTAKVFVCEKDQWSCYKMINSSYSPRLRVDQEMKHMDNLHKLKIRIPLPLFTVICGNVEVLAMERVNGHTIREIIDNGIELPDDFDFDSFFQELDGFLKIMHSNGIYHRDLHEGNVMMDDNGKPWIIDLGDASRSFSEEEAYSSSILNSKTRKMESVRYTSDGINFSRMRANMRKYILSRKANT